MSSHRAVFHQFLNLLWPPDDMLPSLRTKAATGLSLEAFMARRKHDWMPLLGEVIGKSRNDALLSRYLASWLQGHFITPENSLGCCTITRHAATNPEAEAED